VIGRLTSSDEVLTLPVTARVVGGVPGLRQDLARRAIEREDDGEAEGGRSRAWGEVDQRRRGATVAADSDEIPAN
jgi:hypothetical protein